MIHYLFVGIPSIVFEPVAIVALLGGFSAFGSHRKNKGPFFWSVIVAVCIMISWRLIAYSLMTSSRYASILIYPAIIATAWFCFQDERDKQNRTCSFSHQYNTLSRFAKIKIFALYTVIIIIAVLCLKKILHRDLYGGYTPRLCKTLRSETANKDYLLFAQNEPDRIAFYSGIDVKKIQTLGDATEHSLDEMLKQKIMELNNSVEVSYFVFSLKKDEPVPTLQHLGFDSSVGEWECLHQEYTSKRKNKKMVLYRFIPAHPNIEEWNETITTLDQNNTCKNGDFEQVLVGKEMENAIARYFGDIIPESFDITACLLPKDWNFSTSSINGKTSFTRLTSEKPMDGIYSLEIQSHSYGFSYMEGGYMPKKDCLLTGFIQAKKDSKIMVHPCFFNSEKKTTLIENTYWLYASAGKTYKFSISVTNTQNIKDFNNMCFVIQCSGHILLDNIQCIKLDTSLPSESGSQF